MSTIDGNGKARFSLLQLLFPAFMVYRSGIIGFDLVNVNTSTSTIGPNTNINSLRTASTQLAFICPESLETREVT